MTQLPKIPEIESKVATIGTDRSQTLYKANFEAKMRNNKWLCSAAILGFLLPILWGVLGFVLFNLQDPYWVRVFWLSVYISCPAWFLLPGGGIWTFLTPLFNAGVYLLIAVLVKRLFSALKA